MNTEEDEFARIEREQAMRGVPDAIHHTDLGETLEYITGWNDCRAAMLAEQPAQQEPVACQYAKDVAMPEYRCVGRCQYDTSPPAQLAQRTWIGLTDEEVQAAVYDENNCVVDYENYAAAIEAKLKEKNT